MSKWTSNRENEKIAFRPLALGQRGLIEWRWGRAIFSWKWQLEMNWKFRNWKFRIGSLESLKLKVNYKTATVSHRAADHQIETGFNSRHLADDLHFDSKLAAHLQIHLQIHQDHFEFQMHKLWITTRRELADEWQKSMREHVTSDLFEFSELFDRNGDLCWNFDSLRQGLP